MLHHLHRFDRRPGLQCQKLFSGLTEITEAEQFSEVSWGQDFGGAVKVVADATPLACTMICLWSGKKYPQETCRSRQPYVQVCSLICQHSLEAKETGFDRYFSIISIRIKLKQSKKLIEVAACRMHYVSALLVLGAISGYFAVPSYKISLAFSPRAH